MTAIIDIPKLTDRQARKPCSGVIPGLRFGRLVVIGNPTIARSGRKTFSVVVCQCECGRKKTIRTASLTDWRTLSCGCLQRELAARRKTTHGHAARKQQHPLYVIWNKMKCRCENQRSRDFAYYGGRGIRVCEEWENNAATFIAWALQAGWKPGLQIDRFPDNNGNYCPNNCRFVSAKTNSRNRRDNHLLNIFGETKCVAAWADDERCEVTEHTLRSRLSNGWNPTKALTTPPRINQRS